MNEAELRSLLAKYIQAEADLLSGKSVTWGNRQISRESLSEIRKGRHEVETRLAALNPRARNRPQYSLAKFL
ncbi:hypothetical protein GCM10022421_08880 [Oceanisphaera sediminis]|uniref:Primosomal replication protein PriB/PriC domain protein n=1 Tax=Oceanisphaera sediminis TaxID=981381 RepID=A0ABP7DDN4_9GAMM